MKPAFVSASGGNFRNWKLVKRKWFNSRIKDGDLRLLWIFCTIVDCGGFSRAESELQIGLPAISRAVKDLEARLGVRVCDRGRGGFALTLDGERVYEAACVLLTDLKNFDDSIQLLRGGLTGELRIGVLDTLITDRNFCLPQILKSFKTEHPGVHINLRTINTNLIEQSVINGELEIGVIAGRRHLPVLVHRHLYRETCGLYCSAEHAAFRKYGAAMTINHLNPYEFACYPLAGASSFTKIRSYFSHTADVNHVEAVAALIATDMFFGYLPDHYAIAGVTGKKLVKVLAKEFSMNTEIELISKRSGTSPLVTSFLQCVDRQLAAAA